MSIAVGPDEPDRLESRARGAGGSVLHLVCPAAPAEKPSISLRGMVGSGGSDAAVVACREVIRATPQLSHKVIVFGGGEAGARGAALGLDAIARVAPPFGRVELAGPAVRAVLGAYGEPRVIQGWGAEFGALRGRVATRTATWCVADMHSGALESRIHLGPPVTSALTAWIEPGRGTGVHQRDRAVRIALIGDPPSELDALAFVYTLGIMHVAGISATAVIPRGAGRLERALRHIRGGGYVFGVEVTDVPPFGVGLGCDLGLCLPMGPGEGSHSPEPCFSSKLAVVLAAEGGLPVVMQDSAWARSLLPEAAHGCLSRSIEPAALAGVVCGLLEGPGLRLARETLADGLNGPARGLVGEVVDAWGIGSGIGTAR